jgi:Trk K+ transport system NAD-binding subunit
MAAVSETSQRPKATETTSADWTSGVQAPEVQAPGVPVEHREWIGHVIVCGVHPVVVQTVEQLLAAGANVVVIDDEGARERNLRALRRMGVPVIPRGSRTGDSLTEAGIEHAEAVICIESSDLRTLETVLLVHGLRPDIRVVAQLDNPAIARAVEEKTGDATLIDVAAMFAPSVVEACVKRRAHDIKIGSTHFVTIEVVAPRDDTLRELYGSLVPLGVAGRAEGGTVVCPGRDHRVREGDRVTLLGTREEIEARGFGSRLTAGAEFQQNRERLVGRIRQTMALLRTDADRGLRIALGLGFLLLVVSTLVLHFGYQQAGGLPVVSAIYFTVETIATVGFGDFSFSKQPLPMEIFGICLIVAGTTLVTTIFALLTNTLVSRRIAQSLGQAEIPGMRGHVVMVGLGSVGMEVLEGLVARGLEVVVVERDEGNRYLNQVRQLGVPLILGDSTLGQTLDSVNLSKASSVAIVTSDDMANIETGLAVRDRLGTRWEEVPVVLRVFDRELGRHLEDSFDFRHVWSTSAIAAPWFAGAALGMEVLFSFYVGSHPFLLARLPITPGGGLDGVAMNDLGASLRVIAIGRDAGPGATGSLEHPPRRDSRLAGGDDAYLAGPYEELLSVLRGDRSGGPGGPDTSSS